MALLKLDDIKKIYHQGKIDVPAIRGISLDIEKGEFTTIFGPSGSGKTTLLNIIGCLDKPSSGDITYESQKKLSELNNNELSDFRRYNLGFIFQGHNLIPVLTAFENVEFAIRIIDEISKKERRKKVFDILESVGLKGLENRKPNELSGGQKQRVAIARALVKNPKLVLADEPTANLDSETSEEVLDIMLKMNKKFGTTFIFSTHDPQVMRYARRLIEIRDGKVTNDEQGEDLDVPH
ncbi:MAG: ABC transporter ATP-binding protein [Halanaerobiales bacterium]|nr:ABC transporter ATP-binding protein [Halanaerobiales bacterium]